MADNALEKTKELMLMLKRIYHEVPMAEGPKKEIAICFSNLRKNYDILNRIHNEVVPLELQAESKKDSDEADLSFWDDAPSGRVAANTPQLRQLTEKSPTLQAFYRNGIDIDAIYRFSNEELAISNDIGLYFSRIHTSFQQFRHAILDREKSEATINTNVEEAPEAYAFLKAMARYNITSNIRLQIYSYKNNSWFDSDAKKASHIKAKQNKARLLFTLDGEKFADLISGHWFNAFTFFVVNDHLERNRINAEVYARVEYTSPPDIFSARGDFDVLAAVDNTVILAECKSGNIFDQAEIDKAISKIQGVKKVFENVRAGYYKYVFVFVYNPHARNDPQRLEQLEDAGITLTTPDQLRGLLVSLTA